MAISSIDPRVLRAAERIRRMLLDRGEDIDINSIILEALRLYEKFRFTPEEELVMELWDRIERLEGELRRIREMIEATPPRPERAPPRRKPEEKREDKFLEFLQDAVYYPLDKIRVSRTRIDNLVESGILDIIEVGGKQYLVYKPKMDELLNMLPIPIEEVKRLPRKMRGLLELLKGAALVYEDGLTKSIKRV